MGYLMLSRDVAWITGRVFQSQPEGLASAAHTLNCQVTALVPTVFLKIFLVALVNMLAGLRPTELNHRQVDRVLIFHYS